MITAFEQTVTTDYDAETAVERELVLRLARPLWRLSDARLRSKQGYFKSTECCPIRLANPHEMPPS